MSHIVAAREIYRERHNTVESSYSGCLCARFLPPSLSAEKRLRDGRSH